MRGCLMNDELRRIWKEAVVAYFKVLNEIFLEGLMKIRENSSVSNWSDTIASKDG
jgi:hypothetical protein